MAKWLTACILLVVLLLAAPGCGRGNSTPSSESTTATSQSTTTTLPTTTTTTSPPPTSSGSPTTSELTIPPLTIQMTGDQVVPPVQTQASGTVKLTVDLSKGVTYEVDVQNISDVISAGLYLGAKGSNGTLVVILLRRPPPPGAVNGVLAQGSITDADLTGPLQGKNIRDLIPALALSGGGAYVQVTTKAHPAGEIRANITQ